jgi:protein gp37
MRKVVSSIYGSLPPLENVWLGTSIEDDSTVFRADWLRKTPAAVRFLSLEPLIGPVDTLDLSGIDWVIVGGESGKGHRPMDPDWVRSIRDRCAALEIPLFFKQWGHISNNPDPTDLSAKKNGGSSKGGALLDDAIWHQFPGRVQAAITPSQPKMKSRKRRKGSSAPTVARSSSAVNQRRSKTAA